jgi:tetratricopeptide (TPR) repeat protein
MQDLIGVQEEIAQAIVAALSLAPDATDAGGEPMETLVAQGTDNLEAYNAVLRGRHLAAQRTPRSLALATEQFERAVSLDPDYAEAWADLGMTNSLRRGWGFDLDSLVEARGAEATERALELDPDMAQAHTAQGYIYAFIHRDSALADRAFARAIELDPRYPTAYHWRGEILGDTGHPDSGIPYLERALELDPLSPIILVDLGTALDQAGRWDEADALFREALELEPDFAPAFSALFFHAQLNGDLEASLANFVKFRELTPGAEDTGFAFWGGWLYLAAGNPERSVEEFRRGFPTDTSTIDVLDRAAVPPFLFALEQVEGVDAVEAFLTGQLSRVEPADSLYGVWLNGYRRIVAGDDAGARAAFRRLEAAADHPDWMTLSLVDAIGDPDLWFAHIEAGFEETDVPLSAEDRFWLEHDPMLAAMRADPRFEAVLDRVPSYPGPAGRDGTR